MSLFRRQCRLLVRAADRPVGNNLAVSQIEVEGLRVQFKIEKTLKPHPNCASISISNLSADSRAKMQKYFLQVILQAGYDDQLAQIFTGAARTVDQVRAGPNWITKIEAGDGEDKYLNNFISESYKAGTPVSDVMKKLITSLALAPGDSIIRADALDGAPFTSFKQGYAVHGKASRELDRLISALGWTWSVQDGEIQILKPDEAVQKGIAKRPKLTPSSGLIGSPEHGSPDKKGKPGKLKAKCLLIPQLRCGGTVEIQSDRFPDGAVFRIEKLVHVGDTMGQDWYSELELGKVKDPDAG